jgi:predicted transcriptional regulator
MPPSSHTVLVAVVDQYQDSNEPVTARSIAQSQDIPEEALTQPLESLCEFELLESTEQGYRPTVTAREFLALDVQADDVLVLDVVEE